MRRIVTGHRLAIRHGDVLLAVPPIHPQTPRVVRQRILELVLRRLIGEAHELALAEADDIEHRSVDAKRLASLMAQTPHRNARGAVAA